MEPVNSQTNSRKNQPFYRLLALTFALLLGIFFLANLIVPGRKISEKEKRILSEFPQPRWNRIMEGSYSRDFEEYASDQILFRDFFTDWKVFGDMLMGKSESQGVYRGKDGFLLEKMETPSEDYYGESLQAMTALARRFDVPQFFVLVPNAVSIYRDKLPLAAPSFDQELFASILEQRLPEKLRFLSLAPVLTQAREGEREGDMPLFYRSDHHWTSYGAYCCAPAVRQFLGKAWQDDWESMAVSHSFSGSLAAKSGFSASPADTLCIYVPREESAYLLSDSRGRRASIYSWEGLRSSDPYTVFLGGNEGLVRIETEHIGAGHLLVFKDSYFNCFLPFLLDAYESIDVVDPRYYSGELSTLLYQKDYDQILYFYNCNSFAQDKSLSLVLGEALSQ